MQTNEIHMLIYFYMKNEISLKYLLLQDVETLQHFSELSVILFLYSQMLRMPFCINSKITCLGTISNTVGIPSSTQTKIHLVVFIVCLFFL